ncbi:hypothetical protein HMPREF9598_00832 [Cutibacterium acnes HL050PA1]|nr:hypothetical protein HMPREF9598_00832 [Cutibacterium acnes HL050PA1]EGE89612.1 hypothetical protein HMPREF9570_02463 [Cutibacterium acnes HL043PA1]
MSSLSTVIRDSSRRTCATRPLRTTHHTTKADSHTRRGRHGASLVPSLRHRTQRHE